MRRKDREVTDLSEIIEIMKNCDVCRLALNDDGFPYILPLNFGMAANGDKITLYFHSALEGYKVGLIRKDNRASFEMDCKHELQYFEDKGYCTMAYESVIGKGHRPAYSSFFVSSLTVPYRRIERDFSMGGGKCVLGQ